MSGPEVYEYRRPYVGTGIDGARRSAQIDREEAATLDAGDERRGELLASAERWEEQAARLERVVGDRVGVQRWHHHPRTP